MTITNIFWGTDECTDCGADVREVTCVEIIDGEQVETLIVECSSAGCVSNSWRAPAAQAA